MTSPFTGTDELEVTRQDGAEKYFFLYCVSHFAVVLGEICNIRPVPRELDAVQPVRQ